MDILIVDPVAGDMSATDNSRFLYLAKALSEKHNVKLVSSDFMHSKKRHSDSDDSAWPFAITRIHEPGYPSNICLQRIKSIRAFSAHVKRYLKERRKPDIIYCAVPPLSCAHAVSAYARKNGVRLILDIQDLWPEAFRMAFDMPVVSDAAFFPLMAYANKVYAAADAICAVSQTYANRALQANSTCGLGRAVFLGTDLESFDFGAQTPIALEKKPDEMWLGYCGTLGASYDINVVIDALYMLKQIGETTPRFIVVGDGPRIDEFKQHAVELGVDTVFIGRLPYDEMCAYLAKCDIAVNPIVKGASGSIINKHADYAAAGIPVINTQESVEYRELVDKYSMGINCACENAVDVAAAISVLTQDGKLRERLGKNARRCAEERFDRKKTYNELVDVIEGRQ